MNRAEYMKELAWLLQDVPDSEREEAFNTMRIILTTPERAASRM